MADSRQDPSWFRHLARRWSRKTHIRDAQQRVLAVATSPAVAEGDMSVVAKQLTRSCAEWLRVERASIWLLDESQTYLELVMLYLKDNNTYESGIRLNRKDYPAYFDALLSGRAIDAQQASTDSRTREFARGYLDVLDIHSMLDAGIRNGEQILGVLCCEKQHQMRRWSVDDVNFTAEMADQFAHCLVNHQKRVAQEQAWKAETVSHTKSRFLSAISHEIRTPLNAMLGIADHLESTSLDDKQRQLLGTLKYSGRVLSSIINDIIEFSQLEQGNLVIQVETVVVTDVIRSSLAICQSFADEKNLSLVMASIDPTLSVTADRLRLSQAIISLVDNAIKYSDSGCITVGATEAGEGLIAISVSDEGPGLSRDVIDSLFMPFEQSVSAPRHEQPSGSGFGLAMTRRYIESMNGSLKVESKPGNGTIFSIVVPRSGSIASTGKPAFSVTLPGAGQKSRNIWVAEDNEVNQFVIRSMLERLGHRVQLFSEGQALIDALHATAVFPDLVLMDYQMPGMDGFRAAELIRETPAFANMPIVVLTAHAFVDIEGQLKRLGIQDYLLKPVSREALSRLVLQYPSK